MSLLVMLMLGCFDVEDTADTEEEEEDTGADTSADTGADTSADTGADTGADTSADTGADTAVNLTLSDDLQIAFSVTIYGMTFEDDCLGSIDLTVVDTTIAGTASCAMQGALTTIFHHDMSTGEPTATVSGSIGENSSISGNLDFELGGTSLLMPWQGKFDGSTVNGFVDGTATIEMGGFKLHTDYTGNFLAE